MLQQWTVNGKLATSKIYHSVRSYGNTSKFFKFVWKGFIPPKFSFISWLAIRNRLKTMDRVVYSSSNRRCPLCRQHNETANHLFFSCNFSLQVWDHVRIWCGLRWRTVAIRSSIKRIKRDFRGTRIHSKVLAIALIATVYHIWLSRNAVIFDGATIYSDRVARTIKRDVCRMIFNLYPTHFLFE